MPPFLQIFRDILLLRRGPQDLPYSTQLLTMVAVASVVMQAFVAAIRFHEASVVTLLSAILSVALTLGALNLMLGMRRLRNRFVQSATALIGCNLVFLVVNLPFALLFPTTIESADQPSMIMLLLLPLGLASVIWQLAVNAHVLRHSLDIPFSGGIAIVFSWAVIIAVLAYAGGAQALA